jgi:hypothetical protein
MIIYETRDLSTISEIESNKLKSWIKKSQHKNCVKMIEQLQQHAEK